MEKPAVPHNEAERLKSLRDLNVLDTPPEERFDRLTRMAQRLFDVPIALVSLVDDDRQWFKSHMGLDATETPRDISFCAHTIINNEPLIIQDASKDERFHDNPLVTGDLAIRFYAACPLYNHDGNALGSFCIIDQKPHVLSPADCETLQDLATMAAKELIAIELATQDELTGINNRRGFMMMAKQNLELCRRQSLTATMVFLDLDKFKKINDEFGHHEGDYVLRTFATLIQGALRKSDILGRLGGDEFVVLLANSTLEQSKVFINRIREAILIQSKKNPKDYLVNFSTGYIAISPDYTGSLEELIQDADVDMYKDKLADNTLSTESALQAAL